MLYVYNVRMREPLILATDSQGVCLRHQQKLGRTIHSESNGAFPTYLCLFFSP